MTITGWFQLIHYFSHESCLTVSLHVWMSWGILWLDATVNIFGHDDFRISINFLQLCFATWKQQSDHFRACFHNLFGESEAVPMLGLIIPHFLGKTFLSTQCTIKIWITNFFNQTGGNRHYSYPCESGTVHLLLSRDSYPGLR